MSKPVVTRFAPSPTGYLHIGGARTALFNWLFARHTGGRMLLRIEDTDRERSTEAATAAILDGLSWLGLTWDGEAISQFARGARHREVAEELVRLGKAYYCYATPAELERMREKARAEGRPPRYDGRWRDRDPSEAPAGAKGAIRVKAPREGETIVRDRVQGEVRFPNKDLDDFIILRSDGVPTYMHAVVVDDHDMGVTHIIRGDDHLTNAARQTIIYDAMGWDVPVMAHIPLIHGADGAKLSKRHGALGVEAYRAMGYLPAALLNYLARLGWSHGDDEVMSIDDMVRWFEIEDVNRGAARFDFQKLEALNGLYMRRMDDAALADIFDRHLALPRDVRPLGRRARRRAESQAARRHARAQGTRQDTGRTCGKFSLFVRDPAAVDRRQGGHAAWRAPAHGPGRRVGGPEEHRGRLDCSGHRSRDPRFRGRAGLEARQRRPAVARGADGPRHVAWRVRRACRPGA